MTAILTFLSPYYVSQVSDRLVTTAGSAYDPLANKALIYLTRNGIVCLAYAGIAYLKGLPTDEWIAERLWGGSLPRHDGGRVPMAFAPSPGNYHLEKAVSLLRSDLECVMHAASREEVQYGFELICAGWQCNRSSCWPIAIRLTKAPGARDVELARAERWWRRTKRRWAFYSLGVPPSESEMDSVMLKVRQARLRPHDVTEALVDTVRSIASREQVVGANLMSILLPPPGVAPIKVCFLPRDHHAATLKTTQGDHVIGVSYTPWIVAPRFLRGPQVTVGTETINVGKIAIEIEGTPGAGGIAALSSSQRRKPAPRR